MSKSKITELSTDKITIHGNADLSSKGDFMTTERVGGLMPYVEENADGSTGFTVYPLMSALSGEILVQPVDTTDTGAVSSGYSYVSPDAGVTPDDALVRSFRVYSGSSAATGNVNLKVYECDPVGNVTTSLNAPVVNYTWPMDVWNATTEPQALVNDTMQVKAGQDYLNVWTISGGGTFSLVGDTPSPAIPGPNNFSPKFALNSRQLTKKREQIGTNEYFHKAEYGIRALQGSINFQNNGDMYGSLFTPLQMSRYNRWSALLSTNSLGAGQSAIVRVGLYRWDFADFNNPTFVRVEGSQKSITIDGSDPVGQLIWELDDAFTVPNPATFYYVVFLIDSITAGQFQLSAVRETGGNSKLYTWRKSGVNLGYLPATITGVASHNAAVWPLLYSEGLA